MKKRICIKRFVIHILAIPAINEEAFDIPLEQTALIACTKKRSTPFLSGNSLPYKLIMEFPDVEDSQIPGSFNEAYARAIIRFLGQLPDTVTDLYICCSKGQSRSAGLAAALCKGFGRSDADVWKNPFYVPNILVYKKMCSELGISMPWIIVRVKKRMNKLAYQKAQKKRDAGKYERWQILF